MAQQTIGVGTTANDGTGDALRSAFQKVNANDTELYASVASNATAIAGKADGTATTTALAGKVATSAIDIDSTMAANSDSKIASQKATKTALAAKADSSALAGKVDTTAIDTDSTFAANSDSKVPSQKAVKTAIDAIVAGGGGREMLTANRTYYVRTDGSDSNNGLANTSGGAFLTLQKAVNVATALDMSIYTTTIQLADGTYTAGAVFTVSPNGPLIINGNATTPANVVVQSSIPVYVSCALKLTIQNFESQASSVGLYVLYPGARVTIGAGMRFTGTGQSIFADNQSNIFGANDIFISGNKSTWLFATNCSVVMLQSSTITFSGSPAWSSTGISFDNGAQVFLYSMTMSGACSGKRYTGAFNAVLNSNGSGTASTYFPGDINGTVATGAQQA